MANRAVSYFPKVGHSATYTELKVLFMNKHKMKHNRNSDTKTASESPPWNGQ